MRWSLLVKVVEWVWCRLAHGKRRKSKITTNNFLTYQSLNASIVLLKKAKRAFILYDFWIHNKVIELVCSWLVMSEAAMLTQVQISLFCCPVLPPPGVDRGRHHPALFTKALTITPGNMSTPDKSAQMLRLNASPWQRLRSCLIGLIFSPGFLFIFHGYSAQPLPVWWIRHGRTFVPSVVW